jgi:hypothetical protein
MSGNMQAITRELLAYIFATVDELWEMVFSMLSILRLYNDQKDKLVSWS